KKEWKPQETTEFISNEEYTDFSIKRNRELYGAQTRGDTQTVERIQKELDDKAAHVATESDYGLTNIVEDKAEIASHLLNPFLISGMLDRKKPILRRKALFLLARFYHNNPA